MGPNSTRLKYQLIAMFMLAISLFVYFTPARAETVAQQSLCGNGSPPDYGFSHDLLQPHWTVGWELQASERAVDSVDRVFDRLSDDAIAQTMILILPQDRVGIPTNCAVHFLRYMELGLPTGERKDNGFVFLIVVQPNDIDVHYAVGLGLPALTASELTNINRAVEDSYQSTHSMDEALLTLANEFNMVARNNYEPMPSAAQTPDVAEQPASPASVAAICGQMCLSLLLFLFLVWMFTQMGGVGRRYYSPHSGPWRSSPWNGDPWGGSPWRGGAGGFPTRGFPSSRGGGFSSPRMRGGSGSGRSGRTN